MFTSSGEEGSGTSGAEETTAKTGLSFGTSATMVRGLQKLKKKALVNLSAQVEHAPAAVDAAATADGEQPLSESDDGRRSFLSRGTISNTEDRSSPLGRATLMAAGMLPSATADGDAGNGTGGGWKSSGNAERRENLKMKTNYMETPHIDFTQLTTWKTEEQVAAEKA